MSYWSVFKKASHALDAGQFSDAEILYHESVELREKSPGTVFVVESVWDSITKVVNKKSDAEKTAGKWQAANDKFINTFQEKAQKCINSFSVELLENGFEYPVPEALFLVSESKLLGSCQLTASKILYLAFNEMLVTEKVVDFADVPDEMEISVDDRLELVRIAISIFSKSAIYDNFRFGLRQVVSFADFVQSLLETPDFIYQSIEESNSLLLKAQFSEIVDENKHKTADLYCKYLYTVDTWDQEAMDASLSAMRIFANIDNHYLPVPDYEKALAVPTPPDGFDIAYRTGRNKIKETIRLRNGDESGVIWASITLEDERWVIVLWSRTTPIDFFSWAHPEDDKLLIKHLQKCEDRIVCSGITTAPLPVMPLMPFLIALKEDEIPADGISQQFLTEQADAAKHSIQKTAKDLEEHPLLLNKESKAIEAGYLWLSCIQKVRASHSCFRSGIHLLAKKGDVASIFLRQFLDPELIETEVWPVQPLAERNIPCLFSSRYKAKPISQLKNSKLAAKKAAVISTDNYLDVLTLWAETRSKLRVVVNNRSRLLPTTAALQSQTNSVTWIPSSATIHTFNDSVDLLEDMIVNSSADNLLMPIFHWNRIVNTHNGDLNDFSVARPRKIGAIPFYEQYIESISSVQKVNIYDSCNTDCWQHEFTKRAEDSALVIGVTSDLSTNSNVSKIWGSEGHSVDWVFLDSATVHWQLCRTGIDCISLHKQLSQNESSHLSLLTSAHFLKQDLFAQLVDWLKPYGDLFQLAINDQQPPTIQLAVMGIAHDAVVGIGKAAFSFMNYVEQSSDKKIIVKPDAGELAECYSAILPSYIAGNEGVSVIDQKELWSEDFIQENPSLLVPKLTSLDILSKPIPLMDTVINWQKADATRIAELESMRAFCALEVCALLERSPGNLDIADPRWWRRFSLFEEPGFYCPDPAEAAVVCAGPSAVLYNLPESSLQKVEQKRTLFKKKPIEDSSLAGAARQWLLYQGLIDDHNMGKLPDYPEITKTILPDRWDSFRSRFAIGDEVNIWYRELAKVTQLREQGELSSWLLYISETPPLFGASVLDLLPATGASVAVGDSDYSGYCPVLVWATPQQMSDPRIREKMLELDPTSVFMADLRQWLPPNPLAGSRAGQALHYLLDSNFRLTAVASSLPESWRRHFAETWKSVFQNDGLFFDEYQNSKKKSAIEYGLAPVAIGRFATPKVECRECGAVTTVSDFGQGCPGCGLSIGRWMSFGDKEKYFDELVHLKLTSLKERFDQRAEKPLCLWVSGLQWETVEPKLDKMGIKYKIQNDRVITTEDKPGTWLICVVGQIINPPPECQHALFLLPADEQELLTFRVRVGGDISLWYHPIEFGFANVANDPEWSSLYTYRYRHLLTCMHMPPGMSEKWQWDGCLPERVSTILTGLPAEVVNRSLEVAAWLMPVAFDGQFSQDADEHIELKMAINEIRQRGNKLKQTINKLLPAMLSGMRTGTSVRINLCALPLEIDADELAWFDRFLLTASLVLGNSGSKDELLYCGDGGVVFTPFRRLGYIGNPAGVCTSLISYLNSFLKVVESIYDDDANLTASSIDAEIIDAGIMLGVWRLSNSRRKSIVCLAEPKQWKLFDDLHSREVGALLADLSEEQIIWQQRLVESWRNGFLEDLRPIAEVEDEHIDDCDLSDSLLAKSNELSHFLKQKQAGQKVLRGHVGSGRLEALVLSLRNAAAKGLPIVSLNIFAPDAGSAARFYLIWRNLLPEYPIPHISISGRQEWVGDIPLDGSIAIQPEEEVAVLLDGQSMVTLDRYRIAQRFRNGRSLIMYDPSLAVEEWEHMFLSTPLSDDIIDFENRENVSKDIIKEVSDFSKLHNITLLKSKYKGTDYGECNSHLTSNLDEAISIISRQASSDSDPYVVNIVAPLVADIEYVGKGLAKFGFLSVYNEELDALLLPGLMEFVATAFDLVRNNDESILEPLLPPSAAGAYNRWRKGGDVSTVLTVADLLRSIDRVSWSKSILDDIVCRQRINNIVSDAGSEPLERFISRPLFKAWRQEVSRLSVIPECEEYTPVARLLSIDEICDMTVGNIAYICRGTELPEAHYKVICRAKDNLQVFYQECSPLPCDDIDE